MNNRRKLVIALGANALAAPLGAFAQQSGKVARIGWLSSDGPDSSSVRIKAFQQRLHELGHIEGKNIVFEFRFAQGKLDQHPTLAAELVSLKPDCVLAVGVDAIRALKQSTNTIPIVMGTIDADPVEQGFAASLSRPGGISQALPASGGSLRASGSSCSRKSCRNYLARLSYSIRGVQPITPI